MSLKPQDIVVLLKLCGYGSSMRPPYAVLAGDLGMSQSEIFGAVKRLNESRLLQGSKGEERPNPSSVKEFLIHGVKYAFPAVRGASTRGIPTSYAAEPLNRVIRTGEEPIPVWPDPKGTKRGVALAPLYKTVPGAAKRDAKLYELLSLVDAIRDGRARERNLAEKELIKRLEHLDG